MPWRETSPMDQRLRFIADYQRHFFSVSELCVRFGVSRKTAYKWIERYQVDGPAGLQDRSRKPHACPHQTPGAIVEALLEARHRHPTWGAKKLLRILSRKHPDWEWPARSTGCDVLKRHGLVISPRRRRLPSHPGRPVTPMTEPNEKGRYLLLSARGGRWLQPLPAGLPGTPIDANPRRPAHLPGAVRRARIASDHPNRQRRALRDDSARTSVDPVRLVDSPGHLPRTHRAGASRAERPARTHAPDPQGRGDASTVRQSAGAAAALQPVSDRVQRGAPS